MPESAQELAAAGYLPVDVDLDAGTVVLAPLAAAGFGEVWFDDTVATVPAHDTRVLPVGEVVAQFAHRRAGEPVGLVAHVSRCGSTLLANLLTLRPATMVAKEPDFITIPARGLALATGDAQRRRHAELLVALLNLLAHAARSAGRVPIVKLSSWTVPVVAACLAGCDDTRWLFQWREPNPVVSSNLATPSSWGQATGNGRAARRLVGADDPNVDPVEFYAATWTAVVDSFLGGDAECWRSLSYEDLVADKASALRATERWFGITGPGAELPAGFEQEGRRYSKGPRTQSFDPAGTHSRVELDADAAARVAAISDRALARLRAAPGQLLA